MNNIEISNEESEFVESKNTINWSIGYLFNQSILENNRKDFLKIENLSVYRKSSKVQTLFDVSFELHPNSFHIFIGENGAGKSTTIKSIIGEISDYTGVIYFNSNKKLERYKIFYVPDQQPKFPNVSILDYLFNLTKLLTDKQDSLILSEIDNLLNRYSLENIKKRNVNRLSAGQKQKILIISAFLVDAPYIVLDEPFANLDPTSRYSFMMDLKELSLNGTCIFLSTHILDEIKDYATHATFIKKGRLIESTQVYDPEYICDFYKNNYLLAYDKTRK